MISMCNSHLLYIHICLHLAQLLACMQGLCSIIGLFADYSISLLLYESIMHVHVSAGEMKKNQREMACATRKRTW
jgi:hypothetical protein